MRGHSLPQAQEKRHKPHWTAFDIRMHFDNTDFFMSTLLYVNAILLAIAVLYAVTQNINLVL